MQGATRGAVTRLLPILIFLSAFTLAREQEHDILPTWAGELSLGRLSKARHESRFFRSKSRLRQFYGLPGVNPGLPSSCVSYEQRYDAYKDSNIDRRGYEVGNTRNPHSKFIVVMQMHHTAASMKEDLVLATRAVAQEAQEAGYHFYILYQVPSKELSEAPDEEEEELTREEMLALLPPDLRGLVVFHDVIEEYRLYYPKISQHARDSTLWGPGHRAPHAAISVFMHRYKRYQFAFVMEYDCRLTGGHWGRFLNAALHQAIQAKGADEEHSKGVSMDEIISTELPKNTKGLPDLVAFGSIWRSDKWAESQVRFNETELEEMKAMIYGGSRRLFDKMHELAEEGRSMYIESLLPAIPRHTLPNGKTVVIKIPMYRESFHCCSQDAADLYSAFYNSAGMHCLPTMLLHPVKNKEDFWPISSVMATAL